MVRSLWALALFGLCLTAVSAPAQDKTKSDKFNITSKIGLREAWFYDIEVSANSAVDLYIVPPSTITKEKDGSTTLTGGRPIAGKKSFTGVAVGDKLSGVTFYSKISSQFVGYGKGGDWGLILEFDPSFLDTKRPDFTGSYTLTIKATVSR